MPGYRQLLPGQHDARPRAGTAGGPEVFGGKGNFPKKIIRHETGGLDHSGHGGASGLEVLGGGPGGRGTRRQYLDENGTGGL